MKDVFICFAIAAFVYSCKPAAPARSFQKSLFKSYDLTRENLFSKNIEGPAVDKDGNLFVVNYLKDGTIGQVKPDGSCELFVQLPDKSTGNSIQFNKDGNMLVADFTGHNILEIDVGSKRVSTYCHSDAF